MRTSFKPIGTLCFLVCSNLTVGAEDTASTSTDSGSDSAVVQEERKGEARTVEQLTRAIYRGSLSEVQTIISTNSIDLNQQLPERSTQPSDTSDSLPTFTPLGLAVLHDQTEIVQFLLKQPNIDVNAKSMRTQKTALHIAAQEGHLECLVALLQQPTIKKNIRTKITKLTPFFLACKNGRLNCVTALLTAQVDIDIADSTGVTPLTAAKHSNHTSIVLLLEDRTKSDELESTTSEDT